jgi:hypothetical protein
LIVDYKHQDYKHQKHRNIRRSGKKLPLELKILTEEMANTEVYCPQHKKYSTLQMFLAAFYLATQLPKITRGWEAEGLEKEAKVCFISLISRSSSSALPSSPVPGPP